MIYVCGIDGFFSTADSYNIGCKYYEAHKLLAHRGPDDEGFVALKDGKPELFIGDNSHVVNCNFSHINTLDNSNVVLGHTRLSIIDLSPAGHQPMSDSTGRYYLVFNGEIYNYIELKQDLIKLGYSFSTTADSEVVLYAIIEWGEKAFNKFNGMWALAFWDSIGQDLWLSRDRFGIKPLFVCDYNGVVVFASEIKFIKMFLGQTFKINRDAVDRYLNKCLLNCDQQTFWEGIEEVKPAHVYHYSREGCDSYKYWKYEPHEMDWDIDSAVLKFAALFNDAVALRLRSDVAVGVTLSGGLDSNLVASEMVKLSPHTINVFSAVYYEKEYSEKDYIDRTKEYLNVDVNYIYPTGDMVEKVLDDILYYTEEPIRSLNLYSMYNIYKYVRENTDVKVVLNGQGSDELFGGYTAHYFQYFVECILNGEIRKFINECKLFSKHRGYDYRSIAVYTLWGCIKNILSGKRFNDILFEGVTTASLREYLLYDDRMSMAYGIESRAPFMDYRIVEFAYSLKKELKINNFKNKVIPRTYGEGKMDESILTRKDKLGYVSPHLKWQQDVLKDFVDRYSSYSLEKLRSDNVLEKTANLLWGYRNISPEKKWRLACLGRWSKLNL